jgi:hypothetical protein
VLQEDVIVLHPLLEVKVLDIHMAATLGGTFCIAIMMAAAFSSYNHVVVDWGSPSSIKIQRRNFAILAADTTVMNYASVELQQIVVIHLAR